MHRRINKFLWILSGVCFFMGGAFAQNEFSDVTEDFGIWNTVSVEYDYSKDWKLGGQIAFRLEDNATGFRSSHIQADIVREFKYNFDLASNFRYTLRPDKQVFRLSGEMNKSFRIKPINIKYRSKVDWDNSITESDGRIDLRWRNRLGLQYKRKKHKMSANMNIEWFHNYDESLNLPDDIRVKAGVRYKFSKAISVGVDWMMQEERNTKDPQRDYVLDMSLKYEIGK